MPSLERRSSAGLERLDLVGDRARPAWPPCAACRSGSRRSRGRPGPARSRRRAGARAGRTGRGRRRRRRPAARTRWRRPRGCWPGTGCPGPPLCWPPRPGRRCRRTARWPARRSCELLISARRSSRSSGTLATPDVGVLGGEGVGRGQRRAAREGVVERGLARVGEPDEPEAFHRRQATAPRGPEPRPPVHRPTVTDRRPVDDSARGASNRVVYLLDRSLAPSRQGPRLPQRGRGRRRARRRRARAPGRRPAPLTELPGIGDEHRPRSSPRRWPARSPTHLAELEADARSIPLGEGGRRYREALRGDCHATLHLVRRRRHRSRPWPAPPWSSATSTWCITDHSPRLTVAHGLNRRAAARASSTRSPSSTSELAPFRILTGIEVDILEDGTPRPGRRPARRGSTSSWPASTRSCAMDRAADDPAPGAGRGQPPRRHPRPLHRPQAALDGDPGGVDPSWPPSRSSTPRSCSPPAPASTRRSRSTAGPSARTRPTTCSTLALEWDCKVSHRHRRPRPRPARMAGLRLRQGGPARDRARPHRQHLAGRRARRMGCGRTRPGSVAELCRRRPRSARSTPGARRPTTAASPTPAAAEPAGQAAAAPSSQVSTAAMWGATPFMAVSSTG